LLEKLAPWSRHPDLNLVRYHGVLAPNANDRAHIVPGPKVQDQATDSPGNDGTSPRHSDATDCRGLSCWRACSTLSSAYVERCGGTVKVVAALTEPGAIRKYLPGVGLPARAPTMAPAGRRPQQEFDIDYAASAA